MWNYVSKHFSNFPSQKQVARKLIELGLTAGNDGKIRCGGVEVKEVSLAKASGVDRRVVRATIRSILEEPKLSVLFGGISPAGAMLRNIAEGLGFGVVEIEADAKRAGIIAKAASLLASKKISIRQVYANDPELFENPVLIIIAQKRIPGNLLEKFSKIPGVKKVSIF